jgi:hypothetical protein
VTVTVTVEVTAAAVGVPEIRPLEELIGPSPAGRPLAVKVSAPTPPLAGGV